MSNEKWERRARCVTYPPDLFFAPRWETKREMIKRETQAKMVCAGCPVRKACLEDALARNEKYGIWGGKTEKERVQMRRELRVRNAQTC